MTHPDADLAAAWAAFDQGDWTAASQQFATLLSASGSDASAIAEAAFGLAHALARTQNLVAAGPPLMQALALAAKDREIHHALARAWAPRSARGNTINVANLGLAAPPPAARSTLIDQFEQLATIYQASNDLEGALVTSHAIWALGVKDPALFVNMGRLWMAGQNNTEARRFFRKALHAGDYLPALAGLADVAWLEGDVATVRETFIRIHAVSSDPAERTAAAFKAATVQPVIAHDDAEIDDARARFAAALMAGPSAPIPDPWQLTLGPNFYVNYQARDDRALQEATARYFLAATPSLAARATHLDRPRAGGKIRLGMISNYFSSHTIGYLNRGLILGIDRDRFDVVLFRTPRAHFDATTAAFATTARIVDLPADLAAARSIVAEAALDVLHYPEIGMDYFSYFLAFARLARVQTVGWGHPITTGLPTIDLFLSVADMEPADGEQHYSERLVRLKSLSIDVERPTLTGAEVSRAELGLEANRPAYVCAQSLYKVHHDFDETIGLILKNDPDGWIYFIGHGAHADGLFMRRLEERLGGDVARVRLLPRVSSERFLHLLKAADVLLDVPQWSGGKTSLEGLSLGTPVVHRPGAFMRGRHTLAFYRHLSIMGAVVETAADYAETAIKLAHDRAFRAEIREQIAATSARLFGNRDAVRETERVWLDALGSAQ